MTVAAPVLTTLPTEILLLISEHLTAKDLVRVSRTCQTLRHLGGCKSVAKGFMRDRTAHMAIQHLQYTKVSRMDLVVELFRRAQGRFDGLYDLVASIAARLNDVKQLEAWRVEFGFIPKEALFGAAQYDRIAVFDFAYPRVDFSHDAVDKVFKTIGEHGSRSLLQHLRKNYPDWVTPNRLEKVVEGAAQNGLLGFAVEIFDSMPARFGKAILNSAFYIARGAAEIGNVDLFSEFIDMFEYSSGRRNEIAEVAAAHGQVEIMRRHEAADNSARSLGLALFAAVDGEAIDSVQYLLEVDQSDNFRVTGEDMHSTLIMAINQGAMDIVSLFVPCVPRQSLLHAAALSHSFKAAFALLKLYLTTETRRAYAEPQIIELEYTPDEPDWKMKLWLVIMGLDIATLFAKSSIDDAERARYLSVLPAAVNLARKLKMNEYAISLMSQVAEGTLEYSSDYYYLIF